MTKTCTKCDKTYPATADFFHRHPTGKYGIQAECKGCRSRNAKHYVRTKRAKELRNKSDKNYQNSLSGYLRRIYGNIKFRCNNPKYHNYHRYGGRGIKNKFESFDMFLAHIIMDLGITKFEQIKGLQVDRIDSNGHYELGNIRFVTCKENINNQNRKVRL